MYSGQPQQFAAAPPQGGGYATAWDPSQFGTIASGVAPQPQVVQVVQHVQQPQPQQVGPQPMMQQPMMQMPMMQQAQPNVMQAPPQVQMMPQAQPQQPMVAPSVVSPSLVSTQPQRGPVGAGAGSAYGIGDYNAVSDLLHGLGLGAYAKNFVKNKVDWETFNLLEAPEMAELVPEVGPRKRLERFIREMPTTGVEALPHYAQPQQQQIPMGQPMQAIQWH